MQVLIYVFMCSYLDNCQVLLSMCFFYFPMRLMSAVVEEHVLVSEAVMSFMLILFLMLFTMIISSHVIVDIEIMGLFCFLLQSIGNVSFSCV